MSPSPDLREYFHPTQQTPCHLSVSCNKRMFPPVGLRGVLFDKSRKTVFTHQMLWTFIFCYIQYSRRQRSSSKPHVYKRCINGVEDFTSCQNISTRFKNRSDSASDMSCGKQTSDSTWQHTHSHTVDICLSSRTAGQSVELMTGLCFPFRYVLTTIYFKYAICVIILENIMEDIFLLALSWCNDMYLQQRNIIFKICKEEEHPTMDSCPSL